MACRSQKPRYTTQEQAEHAALAAPWPLRPYDCPWCDWWHLTSRDATPVVKESRQWKNELEAQAADRRRAERAARHALLLAEHKQNRLAMSRWYDDGGALYHGGRF